MKCVVTLKHNRDLPGLWKIVQEGLMIPAMPCLGRSDNATATRNGNAGRNPLLPYGDIPTGEYIAIISPPGSDVGMFGPSKRFHLVPVAGNALMAAKNGRKELMAHGGTPGSPKLFGGLRPTLGCIRLFDDDIARVIQVVEVAGLDRVPLSVLEIQ